MMKHNTLVKRLLCLSAIWLLFPLFPMITSAESTTDQRIYDDAELLTEQEAKQLEKIAEEHSINQETDFIILTASDTNGKDITQYTQDFYDEEGLGYDKEHGNTAILTVNMTSREIYLAAFGKAEDQLNDERLDKIRDDITPDMSDENYYDAFEAFMTTGSNHMDIRFGLSPNNVIFQTWFQIVAAIVLGAGIVGKMAHHAGGRVTIDNQTYEDSSTSRIVKRKDQYIRTKTTRRKKSSSNSGGSSGGGRTRGGRSHSGSKGKF